MSNSKADPAQPEAKPAKPKKSFRFRFSLASLLMLTTLAAVGMWFWIEFAEPIKRQWRSVEFIQKEFGGLNTTRITTSPSGIPNWTKWLFEEGKSDNVETLFVGSLPGSSMNAEHKRETVEALKNLTHLKTLVINKTEKKIDDRHASAISKLTELETIGLRGQSITDEGAKKLIGLPNVEKLNLTGNPVTWRTLAEASAKSELELDMDDIKTVLTSDKDEAERLLNLDLDLDSVVMCGATVGQIKLALQKQGGISFSGAVRLDRDQEFKFTSPDLIELIDSYSTCIIQFNDWFDPKTTGRIFEAVAPHAKHLFISRRMIQPEDMRSSLFQTNKGLTPGKTCWEFTFYRLDNQSKRIRVQIIGVDLTPQKISQLNGLSEIEELSFYSPDSDAMIGLIEEMPKLKSLSMPVWDMSLEAADTISNIGTLTNLNIWGNDDVRKINLSFLDSPAFSSGLETMSIRYTRLNKQQILPVLKYPNLNSLEVNERAFGSHTSTKVEMLDFLRNEFGISAKDNQD